MVRELGSIRETTGHFLITESHLPTAPCTYHSPSPYLEPLLSATVISFHQACLLARTASPSFSLPLAVWTRFSVYPTSGSSHLCGWQFILADSRGQRLKIKHGHWQSNDLGGVASPSLAITSLSNECNNDTFPPALWGEVLLRKHLVQLLLCGHFPATATNHC